MMMCASLSSGTSRITNLLESEDILLTMDCLEKMGAGIDKQPDNSFVVRGVDGLPHPCNDPIYLGNSGTSMRLLTGIAALGTTDYTLTGDQRMCERPMGELLDALHQLNIRAETRYDNNAPPVIICGGDRTGGKVKIDCKKSSQYLSALLMIGPFFEKGLDIRLDSPPVSFPYVELTMDILKQFGVEVIQKSLTHFRVPGRQKYTPGRYVVEPDLSNAGYFWAIGAVTGQMVFVEHVASASLQGDLKQIRILEKMGCQVTIEENRIGVCGSGLTAVDVDMSDTPDAVPAIAVAASFADGTTRIRNIAHLREKECDRIDALASQLTQLGIRVSQGQDFLEITGGGHHGARIDTFNDHRIAMAFSIPGLLVDGVEIENETCVQKSFPGYWEIFDAL